MALKKVGSRLVAEGASQYISQMGQAATATRKVGEAGREAGSGVDNLNFRSLTLASTLGSLLASAIQKVLGGLANLGKQALNEVASFERLTFSMESLIAKELRSVDATLSMADALEQAGPAAQSVLGWIQKLAIESPFDVDSVAQAFKTAQAYGFTAQEAMNLTEVMIDFASATGATGPVMNQVALALGQIKAKGKLAGQEILQLVNAGISVNPILAKMGFTLNDVSAGLVSADAFLAAFSETMAADFGGAAQRSSETLTGLINTLGDLKAITLREFFTPIFQAAQPHLAAFTSKLQELMPIVSYLGSLVGSLTTYIIENREAILRTVAAIAAFVGAFLLVINAGTIFTAVSAAVTGALTAIGAAIAFLMSPIGLLATAIAGLAALFVFSFSDIEFSADSFFSDFSGNMFNFGHDLILSFAEGMATAINYILDVLIQIGNIIATWLAPGSPPKLLPKIDKWGTDAMNEYLQGFMAADFGIFNQLSNTIGRFIRSLDIPQEDVIPRLLGTRSAIAEAIAQLRETGDVGQMAIKKIMDAIGTSNPAIEGYINAMIRAEAASEAVKEAQERLNAVSEKYAAILQPMNDELDAIAQRRQDIIDEQRKSELEAIIADENAPALAKELAMMELREIELRKQISATEDERDAKLDAEQASLDKAKAEEEAAHEQLAMQEALIQAQTENNELIKQQIALLERLNKTSAGSAGGGGKAAAGGKGLASMPSLPSLPTDFAGLGGGFSGMLDGLQGRIQGFLTEISAPFAGIGEKLETLRTTWAGVFTEIAALPIWGDIKTKLDEWGIGIGDIVALAPIAVGAFAGWKLITGIVLPIVKAIGALVGILGGPLTVALVVAGAAVIAAVSEYGSLLAVWGAAVTSARQLVFIIGGAVLLLGKKIADGARAIIDSFSVMWNTIMTRADEGAQAIIDIVSLLVQVAIDKFVQWGTDLVSSVQTSWTNIKDAISTKKEEIVTTIDTLIQDILSFFFDTDWFSAGANIVLGLLSGIQANAQQIYDAIWDIAQDVWEAITDFFSMESPSKLMMMAGKYIDEGLAIGLRRNSDLVKSAGNFVAEQTAAGFSMPITSPALAQSAGGVTYNQNRLTVGENINISDGLDLHMLLNSLQQVINDKFPSQI